MNISKVHSVIKRSNIDSRILIYTQSLSFFPFLRPRARHFFTASEVGCETSDLRVNNKDLVFVDVTVTRTGLSLAMECDVGTWSAWV